MTLRKPRVSLPTIGTGANVGKTDVGRDAADGEECPPIRGDETLLAEGWCRRYLADDERAKEAKELYVSMGYEVLLRSPDRSQLRAECDGCHQVACRDYFLVYTRMPREGNHSE